MEIKELINRFLAEFSQERDLPLDKRVDYEHTLDRFKEIISLDKLEAIQAKHFLDKENNFIIESFLGFITCYKNNLSRQLIKNINIFAEEFTSRPISAKDYDERIQSQPLQFQVDNYYKPKDSSARKRIEGSLKCP